RMKVYYHIHVDPLVINPNGELVANPSSKPIEYVINRFVQTLPFDGKFRTTALTDAIQQITVVINPVLDSCEVKYGMQPYQSAGDVYTSNAGYMTIDPNYPLSSTITYIS